MPPGAVHPISWAKGDLMSAVGYYHSHTPSRAQTYRVQVVAVARMFRP